MKILAKFKEDLTNFEKNEDLVEILTNPGLA